MVNHKIIFIGPVGAGKSSAIRAVSEIACLETEARISDREEGRVPDGKLTTTVAMDYGRVTTVEAGKVHLYGAPGQERFGFMWDMLSDQLAQDADGVILLLDNTRPDPRADMEEYLGTFASFISGRKLVIGVTRTDLNVQPFPAEYERWLREKGLYSPIRAIDARDGASVRSAIELIVGELKGAGEDVVGARSGSERDLACTAG